ncbi:MAG: DMP19 family protein [Nannocystales bacterium]
MVCESIEEVQTTLELYSVMRELDNLGVTLPLLRRPRGTHGEWDVARYRGLPAALRAASVASTFRAELANGGIDQFAYNQLPILGETMQSFVHIGASGVAHELLRLGEALLSDPEFLGDDVVAGFMGFRKAVDPDESLWTEGYVPEVQARLLQFASAHPEQFVVAVVARREWDCDTQRFRADVLRMPDGTHEVRTSLRVKPDSRVPAGWTGGFYELARPATTFSLEQANAHLLEEIERRATAPTTSSFVVSSFGTSRRGAHRVYPAADMLGLDLLPVGRQLKVRFTRESTVFETSGRFLPDLMLYDGRAYGELVVDEVPADTERWPPPQRRWHACCQA